MQKYKYNTEYVSHSLVFPGLNFPLTTPSPVNLSHSISCYNIWLSFWCVRSVCQHGHFNDFVLNPWECSANYSRLEKVTWIQWYWKGFKALRNITSLSCSSVNFFWLRIQRSSLWTFADSLKQPQKCFDHINQAAGVFVVWFLLYCAQTNALRPFRWSSWVFNLGLIERISRENSIPATENFKLVDTIHYTIKIYPHSNVCIEKKV